MEHGFYLELGWLPTIDRWPDVLATAQRLEPVDAYPIFQQLANSRMDFVRASRLDRAVQRYAQLHGCPPELPKIRFALLSSSVAAHLLPGIRLGAHRRGVWLEVYEGDYGMYRQEIRDGSSGLYAFKPDVVCLSMDAHHLAGADGLSADAVMKDLRACWRQAREEVGSVVLQQTVLPVHARILGNQENRADSPAALIERINQAMRLHAEKDGVYLLAADAWASDEGLLRWYDPALWNRAKQEIHPRASNFYGDQVGRVLAAVRGRSSKCLVMDLDNTLWGGVIGDDGLEGIALGQGSAVGEAYLAIQRYALALARRGVILAVCSKNDEANARMPFERHPEMLLKSPDIACFVANWEDKATNLRHIARTLNIGLDALVFVDDNPAERALIRKELPMVAVPELGDDPAFYVQTIAAAGYFEALDITDEDRARVSLYAANAEREQMRSRVTDMASFLDGLRMELTWSEFDSIGHRRIVQLLNKTNQFNLTTQRYTDNDVASILEDRNAVTLQLRLTDVYGDNGVIALLIGQRQGDTLAIETWLMSCRVLGRNVEDATLNILVDRAREAGVSRLVGSYRPTAKNSMVRDHYEHLGFSLEDEGTDGSTRWSLSLDRFTPRIVPMQIRKGDQWKTPISMAS